MDRLIAVVAAATPSPSGAPGVDPNLVTPGPWGFAVVAVIAVATVLLVWDMLRRVRRARYRLQVREDLDAEARDVDPRSPGPEA